MRDCLFHPEDEDPQIASIARRVAIALLRGHAIPKSVYEDIRALGIARMAEKKGK